MKRLWLIALLLFSVFSAFSQSNILDSLVVSAFRLPTSFKTLSLKTSSIGKDKIKAFQPQTAADLLGIGSEVFIQKSQQIGGSPMMRGFGTNRLLLAVDGVRMNTAIFRAGNLQQVVSIDPFVIEKAEVCFGPGSVMYGSDAIGGVISFNTIKPQFNSDGFKANANVATRLSSANNEFTYHGRINLGSQKFASLTAFSTHQFGDVKMGSNGPTDYLQTYATQTLDTIDVKVKNSNPLVQTPSAYSQINLLQKFRFEPNKYWEIEWTSIYAQSTNNPRYDRLNRFRSNGNPYSAQWYYGPQIWMMHLLEMDAKKSTKWYDNAKFHLAYQQFKESRHDRNFNDPILRHRLEKVNAYCLNADFEKHLSLKFNWRYGAEWVGNQVVSTGQNENIYSGLILNGPSRYPNSFWQTAAIYSALQFTPKPNHYFNAGVRANYFALQSDFSNNQAYFPIRFNNINQQKTAFTGSLGWAYHAKKNHSYRVNLASGFRAPNVDDAGKVFDSQPGSVLLPNAQLGAEYIWNAETGFTLIILKKIQLDISTYFSYLQGAMVRRNAQLNGIDSIIYDGVMSQIQTIQNAAFARVYGIQANVKVNLPYHLEARAHFNYQQGIEETDLGQQSPMMHLSPSFGSLQLQYQKNKLLGLFYLNYCGQMSNENLSEDAKGAAYLYAKDGNGLPYAPAWHTLNIRINYTFRKYFQIMAAIENISDQRYRPYRSGISAAGRNFVLGLNLQL
jgi:hemoglobin/transferrin/lactoferrin receptor protein